MDHLSESIIYLAQIRKSKMNTLYNLKVIGLPANPFLFQQLKEALSHHVVIAVTTDHQIVGQQEGLPLMMAAELATLLLFVVQKR